LYTCVYIRVSGLINKSGIEIPYCAKCNEDIVLEYHVVLGIPNKFNTVTHCVPYDRAAIVLNRDDFRGNC
jgi:hypothetical protein